VRYLGLGIGGTFTFPGGAPGAPLAGRR
jgi:hypothetical protein